MLQQVADAAKRTRGKAEPKRRRTAAPKSSPIDPPASGNSDAELDDAGSRSGFADEKPTKKPTKKLIKKPHRKSSSVVACAMPAASPRGAAAQETPNRSLLKRPAAAGRPRPCFTKVTKHHGGKFYRNASKNRLRVQEVA